jgi:hypothetical protein
MKNKTINKLLRMQPKVINVTKTNYTLDNGDIFEHTFDIDESISVEEFQKLLDNAKTFIVNTLNKIDNDEL